MEKIEAASPDAQTTDLVRQHFDQLKRLFPEVVTEGVNGVALNVDALKALIGHPLINEGDEKFGLSWAGKRHARQIALTTRAGTLRPCPNESVDWEQTQNVMIEGDNLEALKLILKAYSGKVKLIYIDPPYNTGSDFVYPDNFTESINNYLKITGQLESGRKISTNSDTNGRFHTDWLNMMYPRLYLAKQMLRQDGLIMVTIDDGEVANLRLLMDEIFGLECFVGSIAWKKRSSPDARDTLGSVHDWILCYVKNPDFVKLAIGKVPLSQARIDSHSNPDNDPRGNWASIDMTGMTGRATAEQYFEVTLPTGRKVLPPPGRSWGIAKATFDRLLQDNRIWFGASGTGVPRIKGFLSESEGQVVSSVWDMAEVGSNEEAKKDLNRLMGRADVFDTPKPVRLIRRMIEIAIGKSQNQIVMDFFAGSGTTAHAAMLYSAETGVPVRFVVVQIPEPLDSGVKSQSVPATYCDELGKPRNISELTKERLRRAIAEIRADHTKFGGDIGFKLFKLDSSNICAWSPDLSNIESALELATKHIVPGRGEIDILYELILKLGLDVAQHVQERVIYGKRFYSVGNGVLIACLVDKINADEIERLGSGIIEWRRELLTQGESRVIFRDDAFSDDVSKLNMCALLEQADHIRVQCI